MILIGLCSGGERPSTVGHYMHTRLGDTEWNRELNVHIPIRRGGVAQWVVYVDDLDVRGVRIVPPAIVKEGEMMTIDITSKNAPRLIL